MNRDYSGSELICRALEQLGITHVFGLPGTQNIPLFEALRCSHLRTIAVTHEAAAGFMANGYFRASGRIGVFTTISGPGFSNSLTPLAEARHDSAAVLYLVNAPPEGTHKFKLQALDQAAIAGSIAKAVVTVSAIDDLVPALCDACTTALSGEPGPVVFQFSRDALTGFIPSARAELLLGQVLPRIDRGLGDEAATEQLIQLLRSARRPIIYAGQGCNHSAEKLARFAESRNAPVIMTRSARGVLPMDHPLALAFDYNGTGATGCNALLSAADLVLVLGCKLGHNGSAGFRIQFPAGKTVQVDASVGSLAANYPVCIAIHQDVGEFLDVLLRRHDDYAASKSAWTLEELQVWRNQSRAEWGEGPAEPDFPTLPKPGAKTFFDALRAVLPRDAVLVTDTGLHQILSFRYWPSLSPSGLIAPTDFQSMGFALSAAIGAKLACPEREVVVVMGDGGLAMSGMELITAVRENIPLTVIVFNDGALGQIRLQQLADSGAAHATVLSNPEIAVFAEAIGANYCRLNDAPEPTLRAAVALPGVKLVEVPLVDSRAVQVVRAKGLARRTARKLVGRNALDWVKSRFSL